MGFAPRGASPKTLTFGDPLKSPGPGPPIRQCSNQAVGLVAGSAKSRAILSFPVANRCVDIFFGRHSGEIALWLSPGLADSSKRPQLRVVRSVLTLPIVRTIVRIVRCTAYSGGFRTPPGQGCAKRTSYKAYRTVLCVLYGVLSISGEIVRF